MKKIFSLIAVAMIAFCSASLVSCGSDDDSSSNNEEQTVTAVSYAVQVVGRAIYDSTYTFAQADSAVLSRVMPVIKASLTKDVTYKSDQPYYFFTTSDKESSVDAQIKAIDETKCTEAIANDSNIVSAEIQIWKGTSTVKTINYVVSKK